MIDHDPAPTAPVAAYCTIQYPCHRDPDVELILALEAVIDQAVNNGASKDHISFALDYVHHRPRRGAAFAQDEPPEPNEPPDTTPAPSPLAWPEEGRVPRGPHPGGC